jgi:hypothetical protein
MNGVCHCPVFEFRQSSEFQEMKRRMVLMIWITSLTMCKAMAKVHSGSCRGKEMMLIFLRHLGMNHIIGFHASQVGIRYNNISLG